MQTRSEAREARRAAGSRSGRLIKGVGASLASRTVALTAPVVLIPLTYRHFGPTQYAAWATVTATTSMFLWADLGLGNGLLTRLSNALARNDRDLSQRLVSTAYATLVGIAALLLILLGVTAASHQWPIWLGLTQASSVTWMVVICFGLFIINVPLSLVQRVQFAMQEVAQSSLLQMIGPMFSLIAAIIAIESGAGFLAIITLIAAGPVIGSLVASTYVYRREPWIRPMAEKASKARAGDLIRLGTSFLAVQILSSIAMNVDTPLAAHIVGATRLGDFSVTVRLFTLLGAVISVVSLPLWPANAEALARGDLGWVMTMTRRMAVASALAVAAIGALLIVGGTSFLGLLLGAHYHADPLLMIGLTAFWCIIAAVSPLFMVQNSVGRPIYQLVGWPIFLVISVCAKWYVGNNVSLSAVPLCGALIYALIVAPCAWVGYRAVIRSTQSKELV